MLLEGVPCIPLRNSIRPSEAPRDCVVANAIPAQRRKRSCAGGGCNRLWTKVVEVVSMLFVRYLILLTLFSLNQTFSCQPEVTTAGNSVASAQGDVGCGIDPNGCQRLDGGGAMDPNG